MELFWYIVILFMLTAYMILDGFDFGAGIIHLFFAKSEKDKQTIVKAIGPFWDANEVWLIAGGGLLFFAFPKLYASAFSGFYLPLIIILWLLIFRAIGLEFRSLVNNKMWQAFWDKAFGISSLLLALFFGVALGNIVRGVNLGGVINGLSTFEAHYFFLPLWHSTLDPYNDSLGVIDWFTLMIGLLGVVALAIHGANWIIFKTNNELNRQLKKVVFRLNFVLIGLVVITLALLDSVNTNPLKNFNNTPFLWFFPLLTFLGIFGLFKVKQFKKSGLGFLFSSMFLVGGFISTAISIFPAFLPSTNSVNPSLTYLNTATSEYGLSVGTSWFIGGMVLIGFYMVIQHRIFKGKMDDVDYHES